MLDNNKLKIHLVNSNLKKFNKTYYGPICWNNLYIGILIYTKSSNSLVITKQCYSILKYLISCNLC